MKLRHGPVLGPETRDGSPGGCGAQSTLSSYGSQLCEGQLGTSCSGFGTSWGVLGQSTVGRAQSEATKAQQGSKSRWPRVRGTEPGNSARARCLDFSHEEDQEGGALTSPWLSSGISASAPHSYGRG